MRNKISIILGALAIIMAGCSKDASYAPESPDPDAWMHDVTLPVPVRFSAGNLTRSAIDSENDLKDKRFAFFAVDKHPDSLYTAPIDIAFPDNAKAKCYEENGTMKFSFQTNAATPQNAKYYYPMQTTEAYSFYGYYCEEEAKNSSYSKPEFHRTDDSLYVDIAVGTESDILCGKAEADSNVEQTSGIRGFNAKYLRKNPVDSPVLQFEHPASCVAIRLILVKSNEANTDGVTLASAHLDSIPARARLCLAHRLDKTHEGCFVRPVGNVENVLIGSGMALTFGGSENTLSLPERFIMPQTTPLNLRLGFNMGTAVEYVSYKIDPASLGLSNGFERGVRYTLNIKVYSPVKVDIEAKVKPYEDAFSGKEFDPDTNTWN